MSKGSGVCGDQQSGIYSKVFPGIGFNVFFNCAEEINDWYSVPQVTNSIEIKMTFFVCCICDMP